MTAIKLHVLKPSVNNLTVRIFMRAAGLDFEEIDAWGNTRLARVPREEPLAADADDRGGGPAARHALGELRDHAVPLQQARPRAASTRSTPEQRAMVDSAMFYLIGTLYPLLARATYPALSFPQYPGEVGLLGRRRRHQGSGAAGGRGRARRPARRLPRVLPRRAALHRRRLSVDRRHPPRGQRSSSWRPSTTTCLPWATRLHGRRWRPTLGDAYAEPAADVRGYIAHVRAQ